MTMTEDMEYEEFVVQNDNEPDIAFTGQELACARSTGEHSFSNYSGSTGRWTELALYRTAKGKYICSEIGRTQWQGEHDRYRAHVCDTEQEVIDFFGHGWLAKDLYAEANISAVVHVE